MKKNKKRGWGGRPRITDQDNKRTIARKFYLTPKEDAMLIGMHSNTNYCSVSDFIRAMLFENTVKIYLQDRSMEDVILQLNKIGGNINQIARSMNRHKNTYNSISDREMDAINEAVKVISEIDFNL